MLILLLLYAYVGVGRRAFITVKVQDYGEVGHLELDCESPRTNLTHTYLQT